MIFDALGTLNDFCSLKFLLLSTFLLPVFWLVFKFVEERLSPLQKIPSPPGALPLIGHVFEVLRRDNFLQALRSWTNQYAPMFVIHPGLGIGIGEPVVEIILRTIILLSLYVLFTQFDIFKGICLLSFHKLCTWSGGCMQNMDHPCGPTILDKSPWDSAAIFIFFCHFSVPS